MIRQRQMRNYEELRFCDDFMFGKVMEDPELCRDVLECLLQRPVGQLSGIQTQKEFKYTCDGKPIRLDVYNRDSDGIIYDAEMENLNHKTVESHELPKRSRFYQGAIDVDFMSKGNAYRELPESNVLFICTFDPFMKGLSKYTFVEKCRENTNIDLDDGATKIFYNCCYEGKDIPDNLKKLYDYIENGNTESELTKRLEAAVVKGRKNEVWRTQYMKEWVVLQDAREEGRQEGRDLRDAEKIAEMIGRGKTVAEIVEFCNYPEELVKRVESGMLDMCDK